NGTNLSTPAGGSSTHSRACKIPGLKLVLAQEFKQGAPILASLGSGVADISAMPGQKRGQITTLKTLDHFGLLLAEGDSHSNGFCGGVELKIARRQIIAVR